MSKFILCDKCQGLKQIETDPCDHDSTGGSSWPGLCTCPQEVIEEYADYARQEIRFCPYCGAALGIV